MNKPDYVQEVIDEADRVNFPVRLPARKRLSRFSPVCISVVRDEIDRLPDFLEHHRCRGVREFVFLDNGSSDGTPAYLREQPDVFITPVDRPFSWRAKQGWITHVIERIGMERWFLVLDADERLVYPGEDRHDLEDFTAHMELEGKWRIRGVLVDQYPPGPLLKSGSTEHTLFDGDGYFFQAKSKMLSVTGGPRRRTLRTPEYDLSPELTKYPLFRIGPGEVMANPHHLWPYEENHKSPCLLGILHRKFDAELLRKIERAIEEKNYWNDSFEYRAYQAALRGDPDLSLTYEGSRAYESPEDLVDAGLVEAVDWSSHGTHRRLLQLRDRWSPLIAWRRRKQRR